MKWEDAKGREWTIVVRYGEIVNVKRAVGIDLSQAIAEKSDVIEKLIGDPVIFFDTLTTILKPDIESAGLTIDDFAEGLSDEDVVTEASRALIEAIIGFFPKDRRGPLKRAFRRLWTLSKERNDLEAKTAIDFIESPEFETAAAEAVKTGEFNTETIRSAGVSGSPEKSGSIPGGSLSENS